MSQGGASGAAASQGGAGGNVAPGGGAGGNGNAGISLPEVYPPVRAATPTALLGEPGLSAQSATFRRELASDDLGMARQALGELTLGAAIQ